jgi:glycosyltransferase involved in cell wall biosynthesis
MMERRVVGCADCLTTVSIPLANDLASLFKGEKQVEVIYNGYETIPPEFNTSDRIDTKVLRIVYTGTIYKDRRDPSPLFLALNQLESEGRLSPGDVIIDFYGGENANLAQIIHQHNAAKWANIKGFISYKESLNVQKKSDVLLFLESNKPEARGVLTGKIFEYITSGIPIWGIGIDGDCATGQLIRDTQTGVVLGNDVTKIKEAILSHMISSERKMIKPNIDVIKQYSRDNQSQKLLNIISELIRT